MIKAFLIPFCLLSPFYVHVTIQKNESLCAPYSPIYERHYDVMTKALDLDTDRFFFQISTSTINQLI